MRRYALPLALFGLFLLLLQLNTLPTKITHQDNLSSLQPNQQVLTEGIVIKQQQSRYTSTLTLDSGLVLRCERCPNYLNQHITTIAILERYNNKQQLNVLKVATS
ncbi:hypothetical protein CMI48_03245 [Candidatus Pacearchaeota archaeon]|nr:hypothetical protein [Candidatus Pacearchaeota archaeon]